MREYVFLVTFEHGVNRVMDAFIDHPGMVASTVDCSVSESGLWRVDRVTGPSEALDALETAYLDPDYCNECLGHGEKCGTDWEYQVLTEGPDYRTVYTRLTEHSYCHSVPYLATRTLGTGLLFDAIRRGNRYEWRVLVPGEMGVGDLFDALQTHLPNGVAVTLRQLGTPTHWADAAVTVADLPHEQRRALETAVMRGYYETPREATLGDVADALGVPQSTLRYRLRRAEAWLTTQFVDVAGAPAPSLPDVVDAESEAD